MFNKKRWYEIEQQFEKIEKDNAYVNSHIRAMEERLDRLGEILLTFGKRNDELAEELKKAIISIEALKKAVKQPAKKIVGKQKEENNVQS